MEVKVLFTVSVATICFCWIQKRHYPYNQESHFVRRNRQYHAFVQHSVAADDEYFFTVILLPNLEQNLQFQLLLPDRDFQLGIYISSNLEIAIANSNATIILLSQDYMDTPWCTYIFNSCLVEHNNDNAFKLFVILMQPIEELHLTPEMDRFLNTTAYLERHDPQLVEKLKDHLAHLQG